MLQSIMDTQARSAGLGAVTYPCPSATGAHSWPLLAWHSRASFGIKHPGTEMQIPLVGERSQEHTAVVQPRERVLDSALMAFVHLFLL